MPDQPVPETPTATELEQTINQVRTDEALTNPGIPLEIKLETGQVYKGNTPQDLIDQLRQAQENASKEIKRQRDELEALRQAQSTAPVSPTGIVDTNAYNADEYYRRWQTDPLDAQKYLNRYDPAVQANQATLEQQRLLQEIEKFKSNVGGWQAQNKEEADSFISEFQRSGLSPSAVNYEVVYRRMADGNRISRAPISGIEGREAPPPNVSSQSGGPTGFDMDRFASLPSDQQLRVIEQLEKQGFRR